MSLAGSVGEKELKAIVYSCSGSSNVAQAANALAVRLDRSGRAEMSCIAGVGAGVPSLVRVAQSGRPIVAIDGCPLSCCLHALQMRGVEPSAHIELGALGIRKRQHEDMDEGAIEDLLKAVVLPRLEGLGGGPVANDHTAKEN